MVQIYNINLRAFNKCHYDTCSWATGIFTGFFYQAKPAIHKPTSALQRTAQDLSNGETIKAFGLRLTEIWPVKVAQSKLQPDTHQVAACMFPWFLVALLSLQTL